MSWHILSRHFSSQIYHNFDRYFQSMVEIYIFYIDCASVDVKQ